MLLQQWQPLANSRGTRLQHEAQLLMVLHGKGILLA
jgi:hypothetical protein